MTIYQKVHILLSTCFCCNTFWLFEPLTQSTKVFCVASVVLQRVGTHPRFYHTTLHVIATDGPCCHLSTLSSSSQSMFVCRSDTHACWRPFVHIRLCKKPTISLPKTKYAAHKLENYHPQLLSVQIRGWNKVWRQPEHQSRHQNSVRASWQKRDSICVCISTFSGLFCSFQLVSTEGNGSVKFDQCSNTLLLIPPLTIRHSSQSRSASSPAVLQLDILVNTAHLGIPKQLQESPLFEQSHQQKRTDDTDHPLICRASKHDADKNLAAYVKWYSLTNYSLFNFALYPTL